jgi:hypothetical protein
VVVAVRAVLVPAPPISSVPLSRESGNLRILKFARILPEGLLALLADEGHVEGLDQRVISLLGVAFRAVEPFLAWPR